VQDFLSQINYFCVALKDAGVITSLGSIEPRKWKTCKNLRNKLDTARSDVFPTIPEKLWAIINGIERPKCACGNSTKFLNVKTGYRRTCSIKCQANDQQTRKKTKSTVEERYGGKHYTQDKKWQKQFVEDRKKNGSYEKGQATFKQRYGVENRFQLESVKKQIKKTNMRRYGVENPMQSADIRAKSVKTCLERYGEIHHMHVPEIYEKTQTARFKWKRIVLPSGNIRMLQGYEPYVVHYLLQLGLPENDIVTDKKDGMPTVKYEWDGKKKRYYPDIYIPSQNLIIEVKSEYIWKKEELRNSLKQAAAKKAGYDHTIIIWDEIKGITRLI